MGTRLIKIYHSIQAVQVFLEYKLSKKEDLQPAKDLK